MLTGLLTRGHVGSWQLQPVVKAYDHSAWSGPVVVLGASWVQLLYCCCTGFVLVQQQYCCCFSAVVCLVQYCCCTHCIVVMMMTVFVADVILLATPHVTGRTEAECDKAMNGHCLALLLVSVCATAAFVAQCRLCLPQVPASGGWHMLTDSLSTRSAHRPLSTHSIATTQD